MIELIIAKINEVYGGGRDMGGREKGVEEIIGITMGVINKERGGYNRVYSSRDSNVSSRFMGILAAVN
jgi:hypothetical protein